MGAKYLDRVKKELIDQIKNKFGSNTKKLGVHYDAFKLEQEPFTNNIMVIEFRKGFRALGIEKYVETQTSGTMP